MLATMDTITYLTHSEEETTTLGGLLADLLRPGLVVTLSGELGAGKSVLARGVIRGLGVVDGPINSPTFTVMNPYPEGRLPVYHWDFYRLGDPDELIELGADEFLGGNGVALVEWPQRGAGWLPPDRIDIRIDDHHQPDARRLHLTATGPLSQQVLHELTLLRTPETHRLDLSPERPGPTPTGGQGHR